MLQPAFTHLLPLLTSTCSIPFLGFTVLVVHQKRPQASSVQELADLPKGWLTHLRRTMVQPRLLWAGKTDKTVDLFSPSPLSSLLGRDLLTLFTQQVLVSAYLCRAKDIGYNGEGVGLKRYLHRTHMTQELGLLDV